MPSSRPHNHLATRKPPANKPLTASGLLYEANFPAWCQRLAAIFVVKGRPSQAYPAKRVLSYRIDYTARILDEICTIRSQISPALLARVPLDLNANSGIVYEQLEGVLRPFRLFDLPAELRVRVYEEVMAPPDDGSSATIKDWSITPSTTLPTLAQTNRQLRHEVLPIYFATTPFTLHIDMDAYSHYSDTIYTKALRRLALSFSQNFVHHSARHLGHLRLDISVMGESDYVSRWGGTSTDFIRGTFDLVFSKGGGYRAESEEDLSPRTRKKIKRHVEEVEAMRKEEGLEGESLLLATVDRCHMWDYTNLFIGKDTIDYDTVDEEEED